eukprot:CAMPEP_0185209736 /NCGR_PEP_ID=MMETSP1140-20130426/64296_1 /TAXON_ID=298111 /ORGANISM="Pavlova sp., Strain CCMP459" /LENGTH=149 /DNA_ID=CAMNT_0027777503 /DNA_START=640 /DNA_END=1087 /DNA_ORIENTATION=-
MTPTKPLAHLVWVDAAHGYARNRAEVRAPLGCIPSLSPLVRLLTSTATVAIGTPSPRWFRVQSSSMGTQHARSHSLAWRESSAAESTCASTKAIRWWDLRLPSAAAAPHSANVVGKQLSQRHTGAFEMAIARSPVSSKSSRCAAAATLA